MSQLVTNRYVISAYEASELIEAFGSIGSALRAAINQCVERARRYIIPCRWQAHFNDEGEIIVIRSHNRFHKE